MKLILVACNSATAAALPELQESLAVPVVGVITPEAHAAVQATRNRRIGLLATKATVESGRYEQLVRTLDAGVRMTSVACPRLVPLIESDDPFGPETVEAVREYAAPLQARRSGHGHPRVYALPADPADLPARLRPRRHARLLGRGDGPRGCRDARAQGDRERRRPRGCLPLPDHRRAPSVFRVTGARFLQLPIDEVEPRRDRRAHEAARNAARTVRETRTGCDGATDGGPTSSGRSRSSRTTSSSRTGRCSTRRGRRAFSAPRRSRTSVPRWMSGRGVGWLTAEYSLPPCLDRPAHAARGLDREARRVARSRSSA